MNKILRYSFIALLAMVFGNVSAQEFVFDFTDETNPWGFPTEQYKETGTFTKDGKSIVVTTTNYTRWFSDTKVLLFGKKDATLTLPAFDFDVERIDVVGASGASGKVTFNIFVGDDAVSTEVTGAKETATFDIAEGKQAAGTVYVIKNTNDNNNQISKILIWKKGTSGDTPQPKTTNVATVAELNALENGTAFTYTSDVLVVYLNGAYAYIKDDTGSSLIYDSSKTKFANLGTGSRITANWTGKVSIYNNLFEAVPDDVLPTAGTSAVLVTYPDAAITDVVAANMNQVVVLKGVTYTAPEGKNFTISQGGVEVKGYNTFNLEIAAPEEGKTYNITGVISVYKENAQFLPIAIEEVAGEDPGIDPSATIYEVPVSKFTPWDNCTIEGNVITMGEGWKGGAIYIGKDMTQFDYVWIKFKNASATPNFGITYDEWTKNESWGPVFAATTTAMDGTGMVGIKLDKKSVMIHGNAETGGVGIGDVYAQHVQQVTIQGGSAAASVEVEGIWFGTTAEFVKAGGDVPVRPDAGGSLKMWEGELVYNGWGVSSTVDPKYFEVAEVGDIIYCSVKDVTADYNPIFKYQDWSDFTDIQATLAKDETHFEGKIATAEALDYLQKNGLRFQGVGFTLTKVELKVPDPSGVNTINVVKADNGAIYNVAGQKVNAGYKGLVIKNGKKFVNK
jgi:hypothetical protein